MAETGPVYTPIEDVLPAVYRRDPESWSQIREYFAPVNELSREFLFALQELPAWLSPAARDLQPPGGRHADLEGVLRRRSEVLDEVAVWFDFEFVPEQVWRLKGSVAEDHATVAAKARVLESLPRLMRTRATPTGFLELFCAAFRLDVTRWEDCPVLLEHHAYGRRDRSTDGLAETGEASAAGCRQRVPVSSPDAAAHRGAEVDRDDDGRAWQVTMLLSSRICPSWGLWCDVRSWVERHAPAHLWIEIERVSVSFWTEGLQRLLDAETDLDTVLAEVRRHVLDAEGLRLAGDPDQELEGGDALDLGRLPGDGEGDMT